MITVFTPTYNRKELLKNLYASLTRQTNKNFEWIVVDDGGNDGTDELMSELIEKEHSFSIRFYKQKNGGKHRAINNGVAQAQGEYFFIVDDDDTLTPDAIQLVSDWIDELKREPDYLEFAGVSGLKMLSSGTVINRIQDDKEYVDALYTETRKHGLQGDKAEVYRTELLKQNPFPEFDGEKFISESTVWNAIAEKGYKLRWHNKPIYKCEYLEDGLSKNIRRNQLNSFRGVTYLVKQDIRLADTKTKIVSVAHFYDLAKEKGYSLKQAAEALEIDEFKIAVCIGIMKCFRIFKPEKSL